MPFNERLTTGVKALSAATVVWHGLAIITAQVHLMEINARLARIEPGIATIRTLLEAEQVGILVTGRTVGARRVRLWHTAM